MKAFETYQDIQDKIGSVQVLPITKYQTDETVLAFVKKGIPLIGESKVQDAKRKREQLVAEGVDISFHMIGHLQTNKVKEALEIFDVIQSVDSEKLLRKIASNAVGSTPQEIYLQLNLTGEQQKYGFDEEQLGGMIALCQSLAGISCTGLMCMGMLGDKIKTREIYRTCKSLCNRYGFENCSMGMSDDREIAIEEGSTMIRLGSVLFG